jgi:TusE/DsrC/DsvC family sulfur relay protein
MAMFQAGNVAIEVDEDGFMAAPEQWTEEIACALAASESVPVMGEDHWKLVRYLRDYYLKNGVAPMIRKICKDLKIENKYLYVLFPSGPAKGACKVAGLAKPTGCV